MSPEAYDTQVYKVGYNGLKADIFALGLILFFISFGQPAWKAPSIKCAAFRRLKEKGMTNLLEKHTASSKYMALNKINQLADLLERLLAIEPNSRPDSMQEIL